MTVYRSLIAFILLLVYVSPLSAKGPGGQSQSDLEIEGIRWQPYFDAGTWTADNGVLRSAGKEENSARLAKTDPVADVLIDAQVRVAASGRRNFGLVFRAREDRSCLVLRYYDAKDGLQLLRYVKGKVEVLPDAGSVAKVQPDAWYAVKAAAVENMLLGKIWPVGTPEPAWMFRARVADVQPGGVGLIAQDASVVDFRSVRISSGPALDELKRSLAVEKKEYEQKLQEKLTLQVRPTPLLLRTDKGPARRIDVQAVVDDKPQPVSGQLSVTFGKHRQTVALTTAQCPGGVCPLLLPEPTTETELRVTLDTTIGKRIEARCPVSPVRKWTFYMTPHTHYDIGYTHPQPEVIDRLAREMTTASEYCEQTADWPEESRYRWTVEVSGLMKNYIERHTEQDVAKLIDFVRSGRIEICGFYLNMPTEVVGHEELIRCLYYAQDLRTRFGVRIDTAMINDVPGYTWAIPSLFAEAGIPRVSFRANSIRGQFLWYRPKAVPRPFYWQAPDGQRIFVWYTDSYREGNFFREPGLHEDSFLGIISRNEQAGCWVDDIQLRMGGDNLPPDIDASRNARAWNEKYVWPKVVVATNREFLEILESKYGSKCETRRGDIPSWWAEGPPSSALENGITRLAHDRLTAVEALWTLACLADPKIDYPRKEINVAYDKMIHFDEHTWGASQSISEPKSPATLTQWKWKAQCAYDAKRITDDLHTRGLKLLSGRISAPKEYCIAVWNTLTWPRTDVVEVDLSGTPFEKAAGLAVTDLRGGQSVPVQRSRDGKQAFFIARDVPPLSCATFAVQSAPAPAPQPAPTQAGTLENAFYRLTAVPASGGLSSWYDKQLQRELLDRKAEYLGNQPIHEKSVDGRPAIDRKTPSAFQRTVPREGKLVDHVIGPVFQEVILETSLPTCPAIRQHIRLYNDLKLMDILNQVTKAEVFDPEAVYFAFPFDVESPEIRFQIADAVMRPGKDQLTYSCQDFYSIQHWADVAGKAYGIVLAPVEAPLMLVSGLNAYKWADRIDFNNGHLFSQVMNNYWTTNFRAAQPGVAPFRYRLTSYTGGHDPIATTRFAWQPFFPLAPVWLAPNSTNPSAPVEPLIRLEGDPVVISCIKPAEADGAIILRLLEMHGNPANCTVRLNLPGGRKIAGASMADCLERPGKSLPLADNAVSVSLRPNQIATIRLVPAKP